MNTISGGCLCGKFRYRLRKQPVGINDCHCIDCRRASAAPFVTWGSIKARDFEIVSGELRKVSFANRGRTLASLQGCVSKRRPEELCPKRNCRESDPILELSMAKRFDHVRASAHRQR